MTHPLPYDVQAIIESIQQSRPYTPIPMYINYMLIDGPLRGTVITTINDNKNCVNTIQFGRYVYVYSYNNTYQFKKELPVE